MRRVNERMVVEACGCVGWVEMLGGKRAGRMMIGLGEGWWFGTGRTSVVVRKVSGRAP